MHWDGAVERGAKDMGVVILSFTARVHGRMTTTTTCDRTPCNDHNAAWQKRDVWFTTAIASCSSPSRLN